MKCLFEGAVSYNVKAAGAMHMVPPHLFLQQLQVIRLEAARKLHGMGYVWIS